MTLSYLSFRNELNNAVLSLKQSTQGGLFEGLGLAAAELTANAIQFEWGAAILIMGVGLILAASYVDENPKPVRTFSPNSALIKNDNKNEATTTETMLWFLIFISLLFVIWQLKQ